MLRMAITLHLMLVQAGKGGGGLGLGGWFGTPTLGWLGNMKSGFHTLSGYALGVIILGGLAMMVLGGALLTFAGKNPNKQAGAVYMISNAAKGLAFILIGIPIAVLIIGILLTVF